MRVDRDYFNYSEILFFVFFFQVAAAHVYGSVVNLQFL